MTVKEAIQQLSKIQDKNMAIMVDYPYCGRGHQLADIDEMVVLKSHVTENTTNP